MIYECGPTRVHKWKLTIQSNISIFTPTKPYNPPLGCGDIIFANANDILFSLSIHCPSFLFLGLLLLLHSLWSCSLLFPLWIHYLVMIIITLIISISNIKISFEQFSKYLLTLSYTKPFIMVMYSTYKRIPSPYCQYLHLCSTTIELNYFVANYVQLLNFLAMVFHVACGTHLVFQFIALPITNALNGISLHMYQANHLEPKWGMFHVVSLNFRHV